MSYIKTSVSKLSSSSPVILCCTGTECCRVALVQSVVGLHWYRVLWGCTGTECYGVALVQSVVALHW